MAKSKKNKKKEAMLKSKGINPQKGFKNTQSTKTNLRKKQGK